MRVPGRRTVDQAIRASLPSVDEMCVTAVYAVIAATAFGASLVVGVVHPLLASAARIVAIVFVLWAVQPIIANGLRRAVLVGIHNVRQSLGVRRKEADMAIRITPHDFLDGRWVITQDGKPAGEIVIYRTGDAYSVTLNGTMGLLWRGMLTNGRVMSEQQFLDHALGRTKEAV